MKSGLVQSNAFQTGQPSNLRREEASTRGLVMSFTLRPVLLANLFIARVEVDAFANRMSVSSYPPTSSKVLGDGRTGWLLEPCPADDPGVAKPSNRESLKSGAACISTTTPPPTQLGWTHCILDFLQDLRLGNDHVTAYYKYGALHRQRVASTSSCEPGKSPGQASLDHIRTSAQGDAGRSVFAVVD